jgi:RNA polymerase sigma factor (sigma-70 family)
MTSLTLAINDLFLHHREDLAHEAYLKMLQASATQDIHQPRPFLYQIARNLALDHLRKEKVRQHNDNHPTDDEDTDNLLERIPSNAPAPEQQVDERQQVALMLEALNGLPERRRQILVLHKFHHWTYERIARHYGISRSAVEKNVYAALAHLLSAQDKSLI